MASWNIPYNPDAGLDLFEQTAAQSKPYKKPTVIENENGTIIGVVTK